MSRARPRLARLARLTRAGALAAFRRARVAGGYAANTITLEQGVLAAALSAIARRSLSRVTRADLEAHLARRARCVCATSLSRERGALAAFFAFLVREGLLLSDPSTGIRTRPGRPRPPLLLSLASVKALLVAAARVGGGRRSLEVRRARALRNRALVELLYGLGLRVSELTAIQLVDLDLRSGSLLVRRVKRCKPRRLPLPRAAQEAVTRYLREGRAHLVKARANGEARLFVSERGTRISANHLGRIFTRIATLAGVKAHPHALRRAVATHFVQGGVSLLVVRELLGHVRLETTQCYVVLDRDDLRRAVAVLDRGLGRAGPSGCGGGSESPR